MKINNRIVIVGVLILIIVIIFSFVFYSGGKLIKIERGELPSELVEPDDVQYKEAKRKARLWVEESSPTYTYNGIVIESVRGQVIESRSCQNCYTFDIKFLNRTPGYGADRTEKEKQTRVITSHLMKLNMKNGQIVAAITDGVYNELKEEFLP